jgi:GxxExxY protein
LPPLYAGQPLSTETEHLATQIVDAAYKVHSRLGPGLLESVYEACMCHELQTRDIKFKTQVALPIVYEGMRLESALRLDLLVADRIILELKSVEQLNPLFQAQLLSYLKLSGLRLGFLINFNVPLIKQGIQRIII